MHRYFVDLVLFCRSKSFCTYDFISIFCICIFFSKSLYKIITKQIFFLTGYHYPMTKQSGYGDLHYLHTRARLYGKQLFTWLSLVVSFMASFVLSFFPLDVLDGIWDLIESVSEGFLTYSSRRTMCQLKPLTKV